MYWRSTISRKSGYHFVPLNGERLQRPGGIMYTKLTAVVVGYNTQTHGGGTVSHIWIGVGQQVPWSIYLT